MSKKKIMANKHSSAHSWENVKIQDTNPPSFPFIFSPTFFSFLHSFFSSFLFLLHILSSASQFIHLKKNVLRDMSFICSIVTNQQNLMAKISTIYLPHNSAGWHWSGLSWVVLLVWVRLNWYYSCFCSQLTDWQEAI